MVLADDWTGQQYWLHRENTGVRDKEMCEAQVHGKMLLMKYFPNISLIPPGNMPH